MKPYLVAAAVFCAAIGAAQQAPARLYFHASGFSIAPLDVAQEGPHQVLFMMLPATESFAPNVNVQIQPFSGTIEEFVSLSRQGFDAAGLQVSGERIGKGAVTWEYSGDYEGRNLRWYAAAHVGDGRVYVVTATALEQQWDTVAADLKECVDSFRLEGRPPR